MRQWKYLAITSQNPMLFLHSDVENPESITDGFESTI